MRCPSVELHAADTLRRRQRSQQSSRSARDRRRRRPLLARRAAWAQPLLQPVELALEQALGERQQRDARPRPPSTPAFRSRRSASRCRRPRGSGAARGSTGSRARDTRRRRARSPGPSPGTPSPGDSGRPGTCPWAGWSRPGRQCRRVAPAPRPARAALLRRWRSAAPRRAKPPPAGWRRSRTATRRRSDRRPRPWPPGCRRAGAGRPRPRATVRPASAPAPGSACPTPAPPASWSPHPARRRAAPGIRPGRRTSGLPSTAPPANARTPGCWPGRAPVCPVRAIHAVDPCRTSTARETGGDAVFS